MEECNGEGASEQPYSDDPDRYHAYTQTSWFEKGLFELRKSRAYSILVKPSMTSIAGASIGIISISLLTWNSRRVLTTDLGEGSASAVYVTEHLSFFDLLTMSEQAMALALVTFLIGTILAFVIPLSSILQGLGMLGFIIGLRSGDLEASQMGIGYYLAIVSTIILFISCQTIYRRRAEGQPIPVIGRMAALSHRTTRLMNK